MVEASRENAKPAKQDEGAETFEQRENRITHSTYMRFAMDEKRPASPVFYDSVSQSELGGEDDNDNDNDDEVEDNDVGYYSEQTSSDRETLSAAEVEALRVSVQDESIYGRLDRYGFIVLNADGSEIRRPAASDIPGSFPAVPKAHRKRAHFCDLLWQPGDGNREPSVEEQRDAEERKKEKEVSRSVKWVDMLLALESERDVHRWPQKHGKFLERLEKGIPDCVRTKVWALFLGVRCDSPANAVFASRNDAVSFESLYSRISGFERQIDLDIERTLRDHIMFKDRFGQAQVSLFKILVAYSNLDSDVGYCQGMSTVAAFLLLYFEEEAAFHCLVNLMHRDELRSFFTTGFPKLFEAFYIQECLMQKYMPELYRHLTRFHIVTSIYATRWYLTLFLGFPFGLATRLWDLFLYYGSDMLIVIAAALLQYFERMCQYDVIWRVGKLLSMEYEACMQFLSRLPETPINEHRLVYIIMQIWHQYCESDKPGRRAFALYRTAYQRRLANKDT